MLLVNVKDNVKRTTVPVADPAATTIREALVAGSVDFTRGRAHLEGSPLSPAELNMTFADFGLTDGKCFLICVEQKDNA